ncbi:hypothetical protein IV203_014756 [Nitzschia inconspicua]|uniref:Uncharacterized protein n=1 Tax=Nitzschia inconspicua TaxID=303405 RepID=A0A9K3PV09_9STRA|nr:hypothetical protein IV203_014756 [Nitzschia inconspicua]
MYNGLFGDLPAAKKGGVSSTAQQESKEEDGKDTIKDDSINPSTTSDIPKGGVTKTSKTTTTTTISSSNFLFAPTARKKAKISSSNDGSGGVFSAAGSNSILQTVGKAGTSMAFVPTAALKRKKPGAKSAQVESLTVKPTRPETTAFSKDFVQQQHHDPIDTSKSALPTSSLHHEMTMTTTVLQSAEKQEVIHIHGGPTTVDKNAEPTDADYPHNSFQDNVNDKTQDDDDDEEEEITDPYDPYFPNDLLQYWERQAAAEERARLEQETKDALENQRLLREQLDRERNELQQQQQQQQQQHVENRPVLVGQNESGLLAGLADPGMGRGRGRGRGGVSNLPAWLVEKQRKEAEAAANLGNATAS